MGALIPLTLPPGRVADSLGPPYIRLPMNPGPQSQPYPSVVDGSTQGARAPTGAPHGPTNGSGADADLELVRRMQAGDEQALGAFYDRWFPVVSGVVARILRSDGDVEDVIEETFWQAWRQADRFVEGRGSVQTWLLTIARSRALDRLRAAKRRREESLDEPGALDAVSAAPDDLPPSSASDPSLGVERAERRRLVLAALADLPGEQRQALELGYFGGLSQTEIAEQTGQPLGTVKTRMRLAMQKLRERLAVLREDTR
jgi:RNA polymerase sigma-70 factor (ECF subfamily)